MGSFTQALTALKTSVADVQAIQQLPAQAASVQTSVCQSLHTILTEAPVFQTNLLASIGPAKAALDTAIAELEKNADATSKIASIISGITDTISNYRSQATSLVAMLSSATNEVSGSFTTLSNAEGTMQSQIATLQGQVNAAKGQMEAAQKRYYYLLALGPLGLAGLAIALGLYFHWKSQVDDLQNQVNALNNQIRPLQAMIAACKSLASSEGIALQRMTSLKNTIDTTIADLTDALKDLNSNVAPATLELFLRACQGILITLGEDAS
ncbi:chromosome segregation ATPase [Paraburkholderia sp. Clong3]|uniref:hypothetical protein n=1 Tax=unclassified Paraburkholderia TaxID=2615204 RepID=UPI00160FC9CC|nr:hypothetical protein [Paraburkholderia sp. CI2]MBB5471045.1 chromosome segregation ATPase [Paraburkholderia sp. CI2]